MQTVEFFLQMVDFVKRSAGHSSFRCSLLFSLCCFFAVKVNAAPAPTIHFSVVSVCQDISHIDKDTLASLTNCETLPLGQIKINKTAIAIQFYFDFNREFWGNDKPIGLVMSAEAVSTVFLNSKKIGDNGSPATEMTQEVPGLMDKSFYLPDELLKKNDNSLVVTLSSHHSLLNSDAPIQRLLINHYQSPQDYLLRHYQAAFVPLGILLIGFFYSLVLALSQTYSWRKLLIPTAAFFAVIQLIAEIARGLFYFTYPYHDLRNITILGCSLLVSVFLLFYICQRFLTVRKNVLLAFGVLLTISAIYLSDTMEYKTLFSILMPAITSSFVAGYAAVKKIQTALSHSLALLIFVVLSISFPSEFLDIYYYYCLALLFVFFFTQQAIAYRREQREKQIEQARANRLQSILDEQKEREQPTKIKVSHAGKTKLLSCDDIRFCKGARDYVELVVSNEGSVLHYDSLAEMEKTLPSTFLRVHRSYIVNTIFIESLSRNPSGNGSLVLTTGEQIPVSRRIMPKVRSALS